MHYRLRSYITCAVIFEGEFPSIEALIRNANLQRVDLQHANLHHADLQNTKLQHASLLGANLQGADLQNAHLRGANLQDAHLRGALLPRIITLPNIHQAVYDAITAPGNSLEMADWHTCETTHCRAGWVVVLAGAAGAMLEDLVGTSTAAALIYHASDPEMTTPDFYASNEDALADIRRMAGSPAK